MNRPTSGARISWEQTLSFALAAVVGVYAGVAAGLFGSCIRFAQIALFRTGEVWRDLVDPEREWLHRFVAQLRSAHWHPEFALLALAALLGSFELPALARRRRIPLFEADRLRSVALAGAFGLALYYPLLLLQAFNATFHDREGGLFALLLGAPPLVRVLAPALGGLAAGALVRYVSPESGGHGVLEVMEAVHTGRELRGSVAIWKSVAAGVTIGSGGSAGREGPVVHLGGAVGSALARYLRLPRERIAILLACGAGAGIAASFQAPLAGAMFAVEIVLGGDYSVRGFAPIVLSSVMAFVTARALVQESGSLAAVAWDLGSPWEIALYALLGVAAGFVAMAYIRSIDSVHRAFEGKKLRWLKLERLRPEWRPALGGLLVGLIGLFAPRALGTGIESMNAALAGQMALGALVGALAAKIAATALTLGSGAPGGSFFPAVFVGAMLGGAFGQLAHALLPGIAGNPAAYAAVGMGAVVAGSTGAPLTGTLMMFELSGSHPIVLPLLLACGIAAAQVHRVLGGTLYSLQLRAKGVAMGAGERVLRSLSVEQAAEVVAPVPARTPWSDLVRIVAETPHAAFPVASEDGSVTGILSVGEVRAALLDAGLSGVAVAGDLARGDAVRLAADDDLEMALRRLIDSGATEALVFSRQTGAAVGIVTRAAILEAWRRAKD